MTIKVAYVIQNNQLNLCYMVYVTCYMVYDDNGTPYTAYMQYTGNTNIVFSNIVNNILITIYYYI